MVRRRKAKRRSRPKTFRLLGAIESYAYLHIMTSNFLGNSPLGVLTSGSDIRSPVAGYTGDMTYVNADNTVSLQEMISSPGLAFQAVTSNVMSKIKEAIPEIDEQTGQPSGKMKDGSVWPDDMSRSEIFNNLKIQIQAGSSGKPDREQMAQTWAQFLLPRITELIQGVGELRTNGQEDLADSLILVAQETMRRMDERFDIHEFLPREDTSEQDPDKMKAMQEQMELQAVQMEQLKADLEETKSKTVKNLAQADKFKEDAEGDKAKAAITAYKAQEEADRSDRQQMHEQRRDMMDAEMKFSDMQAQDQRDDKEFGIKERQMNKPVTK